MNERIKQLAQQCWDRRLDGLHFDIEMFAELVVRECKENAKQELVIDCPRCGHCCPERQWVGLTDEDYETLSQYAFVEVIEKVEALLKEKNNG